MCHVRPHRPRPFAEFILSPSALLRTGSAEGLRVTLVKLVLVAYLDPIPSNGPTPRFSLWG